MLADVLVKFWNDECGAVLSTEYLMLGTVVAVGGASGMAAMRDSVSDEFREYGQSVREVRQAYNVNTRSGGGAQARGTAVSDNPTAGTSPVIVHTPVQTPAF